MQITQEQFMKFCQLLNDNPDLLVFNDKWFTPIIEVKLGDKNSFVINLANGGNLTHTES